MAQHERPPSETALGAQSSKYRAQNAVAQLRRMQSLLRSMKRSSQLLSQLSEHVLQLARAGAIGRRPNPKYEPGAGMFGTEIPRKTLDDQLDYFDDRMGRLGSDLDFYIEVIDEALEHIARGRY
jgi:hypothetical protein